MKRPYAAALVIVVAQLASPMAASAGDGTFGAHTDLAAGNGPVSSAIGDFNSDGFADLAVANASDGDVSVLLGAGDGSLGAKTDFLAGGTANAVAVGDFNSDGAEDLAVANRNIDKVSILLGAGNGSFGSPTSFTTGNGPVAIAIGDFNADRVEDLALSNFDGSPTPAEGSVSVLLGAGNGSFGTKTDYEVDFPTPSVAVGDFNADGYDDLVTANEYNGRTVSVLLNDGDGDGSFGGDTLFQVGIAPQGVAVGDFNSDGFDDLAVTGSFEGFVSVLLGTGTGGFGMRTDYPVGAPDGVAIGDFNSDGAEDLAVTASNPAPPGNGHVSVLLGAGNGSFAAATDFPVDRDTTTVVVGDLNSDGNQDLAVGHSTGTTVSILLGLGTPYLAGNLLANGGAEGATATRGIAAPQIPGWTRGPSGSMTYVRYPFRSAFSELRDSARWEGGLSFFSGGPDGPSSASQTAGVADSAASIDAGLATANLAADLGGFRILNHQMQVSAEFRDATGNSLGTFAIGPVSVAERHNLTDLVRRRAQAPVPVGTRSITVTIAATQTAGLVYTDAYADNVKLSLDAPVPPPGDGDGGGGGAEPPPADTDPPETLKGKGPKRQIATPRATFRFSSDEPGSSFECRLDRKRPRLCSSPLRVKGLRPGRHRVTATAIDRAGNRDATPAAWRFRVLPSNQR